MNSTINDCKIILLPKFKERDKGALTFVENFLFVTKRIFYLYDIPGGESRGAHAHKNCQQFLVALSGSFSVDVNDGEKTKRNFLNKPDIGLYIPAGIWASELNFSSGSICLVLASEKFNDKDYIRDYKSFKKKKKII